MQADCKQDFFELQINLLSQVFHPSLHKPSDYVSRRLQGFLFFYKKYNIYETGDFRDFQREHLYLLTM